MNFWMITLTPQAYDDLRARRYRSLFLHPRYQRRVRRMARGDRVLFFLKKRLLFAGTATVAGPARLLQEGSPSGLLEVPLEPGILPEEAQMVDARRLAPSLEYVKRWRPEDWPLAFWEQVHLISREDFAVVEKELYRAAQRRTPQVGAPPRTPRARTQSSR
jgi:hypothetical protein